MKVLDQILMCADDTKRELGDMDYSQPFINGSELIARSTLKRRCSAHLGASNALDEHPRLVGCGH